MGRLLAGIVHEIRGPLSVIRGNAELMRLQLAESDPMQQWIDPLIRNAQILQVRLEHLMAAVRGGPAVPRALDLGPLIREATEIFLKGTDPRAGGSPDWRAPLRPVSYPEARGHRGGRLGETSCCPPS